MEKNGKILNKICQNSLLFLISIKKNKATIIGQDKLYGAECISSDLRTTFSIILGAIGAQGESTINRVFHGLRGYEKLENKLRKIGVNIKRVP